MKLIFFFKMIKIKCRFKKCSKIGENVFSVLDNCIWIGFFKFSPFSEKEYLSSRVNVLTNGLKILDTTKTNIFDLILYQNDGKTDQTTVAHIVAHTVTLTYWLP